SARGLDRTARPAAADGGEPAPLQQVHAAVQRPAAGRRPGKADDVRPADRFSFHPLRHAVGARVVLDRPEYPLNRSAGVHQQPEEEEGYAVRSDPGVRERERPARRESPRKGGSGFKEADMIVKEFEGRNEKEAIDRAIEELGLDRNEIDFEIVEAKKPGILFRGGKVKIRVHLLDEQEEGEEYEEEPGPDAGPPDQRPARRGPIAVNGEFEGKVVEF